jgi:hypothetical protein
LRKFPELKQHTQPAITVLTTRFPQPTPRQAPSPQPPSNPVHPKLPASIRVHPFPTVSNRGHICISPSIPTHLRTHGLMARQSVAGGTWAKHPSVVSPPDLADKQRGGEGVRVWGEINSGNGSDDRAVSGDGESKGRGRAGGSTNHSGGRQRLQRTGDRGVVGGAVWVGGVLGCLGM